MIRIAMAISASLILGGSVGFIVGSYWSDRGGGTPRPTVSNQPIDIPPARKARAEAENDAELSEESYRRLEEALKVIPVQEQETGSSAITGSVLTAEGVPLRGVLLRATRNREDTVPARPSAGVPADTDLIREVVRDFSKRRWERSNRREALTDAGGAFQLNGLATGSYTIQPYAEGFEFTAKGFDPSNVMTGTEIDFTAQAVVPVPCDVLLPDGGIPITARIQWRKPAEGYSRSAEWTPRDPIVRFLPGTYAVHAISGEVAEEYRSDDLEVTLEAGVKAPRLVLQLKPRPGVRGKVIFPAGEEMNTAPVRLLRLTSPGPPDLGRLQKEGKVCWAVRPKGFVFSFQNIEPGSYVIGAARAANGPIVAAETIEVSDGTIRQDLEIPALDPENFVIVWILGPGGEVLQDVSITTGIRSPHRSTSTEATVIKQDDGSRLVLHHEADFSPRKEGETFQYVVAVQSKKYGRKEVLYRRGELSEITIQFTDPAVLEVSLLGYDPSVHEGNVRLSLEKAGAEEGPGRNSPKATLASGADGRLTFAPVEPGAYDVILLLKTKLNPSFPIARTSLQLREGKNEVSLRIPPLYPLTVIIADVKPSTWLRLQPFSVGSGVNVTNLRVEADGRVEFPALPAGEYRLQAWESGTYQGEMRVTLPGTAEVQFVPRPLNALAITVRSGDGYLAKIGLQTGDLIIGLDGVEFKDGTQMQELMMGSGAKGKATLRVLRGAEDLDVEVDPKMIMDPKVLGGGLSPITR